MFSPKIQVLTTWNYWIENTDGVALKRGHIGRRKAVVITSLLLFMLSTWFAHNRSVYAVTRLYEITGWTTSSAGTCNCTCSFINSPQVFEKYTHFSFNQSALCLGVIHFGKDLESFMLVDYMVYPRSWTKQHWTTFWDIKRDKEAKRKSQDHRAVQARSQDYNLSRTRAGSGDSRIAKDNSPNSQVSTN